MYYLYSIFNPQKNLQGKLYYPHFTDEKTSSRNSLITHVISKEMGELIFETRWIFLYSDLPISLSHLFSTSPAEIFLLKILSNPEKPAAVAIKTSAWWIPRTRVHRVLSSPKVQKGPIYVSLHFCLSLIQPFRCSFFFFFGSRCCPSLRITNSLSFPTPNGNEKGW